MATSSINHNIIIKSKKDGEQFCKAITEAEEFHNNKKPIIITVSGKARHGKDFTAVALAERFKNSGKKVLITHYADLLKFICKNMFNWNGKKDEAGRHILQYVGTDIVRKQSPDFWVDYIINVLTLFGSEWDYVIIPDTRFPNEIERLQNKGQFQVISIHVNRINFDNGLSKEAQSHLSEHALDNFNFDFKLINNGDKTYLKVIDSILGDIDDIVNNR